MAAVGIHADRHVGNQSDPHTVAARILLHFRKALGNQPLQEHVKLDLALFGSGEVDRSRGCRGPPFGRPIAPPPFRVGLREPMSVYGLEQGMFAQALAPLTHEREEVLRKGIVDTKFVAGEVIPQTAQRVIFDGGTLRPVDQIVRRYLRPRWTAPCDAGISEQYGGVGIQHIEEYPVRRGVRPIMSAVCGKQAVRRTKGNGIATLRCGACDKLAQRSRIAESAVGFAPQRIQLGTKTPGPDAWCDIIECDAARRRDSEIDFASTDAQTMISGGVNWRQQ